MRYGGEGDPLVHIRLIRPHWRTGSRELSFEPLEFLARLLQHKTPTQHPTGRGSTRALSMAPLVRGGRRRDTGAATPGGVPLVLPTRGAARWPKPLHPCVDVRQSCLLGNATIAWADGAVVCAGRSGNVAPRSLGKRHSLGGTRSESPFSTGRFRCRPRRVAADPQDSSACGNGGNGVRHLPLLFYWSEKGNGKCLTPIPSAYPAILLAPLVGRGGEDDEGTTDREIRRPWETGAGSKVEFGRVHDESQVCAVRAERTEREQLRGCVETGVVGGFVRVLDGGAFRVADQGNVEEITPVGHEAATVETCSVWRCWWGASSLPCRRLRAPANGNLRRWLLQRGDPGFLRDIDGLIVRPVPRGG